ncbi:hypothetical protein HHK36_004268 [Tetracentron sinense]|uniref:F-box domain-containing protein n=1 Tax=Tetracentron sinense TaxID=13715 RepID=A0A834ZQL1_TETSI|nr:hypothetical protein HHK36_004268 [Tetracentron sinense]
MVGEGLKTEDLDLCFQKLVVFGGGCGGGKMGGRGVITDWKDIPMELLLRIVSLVDDRTVIIASGVCTGWRDAICLGLTHLSLAWVLIIVRNALGVLGHASRRYFGVDNCKCKNSMNNLVLSLAPKFTKLQALSLRQNVPQLQDNAVETIAKYCPDLQDLDLSKSLKLSDRSLYALAHGCIQLTKLNISGCSAFGDVALAYLTGCCRNLKFLNLCGCVRAASDRALKAIAYNCAQLHYLNLGWCEDVTDVGVMRLAYGCPGLRALDLCGCILITDESVIALANRCLHLRSLGLYYCQNITDKAMYSLAHSRVKEKHDMWESVKSRYDEEGLMNLNISQCTALTPPAVQAVCDSFPSLHTCPGRHSLIISGCLSLTSVHCACAFQAHRTASNIPHPAH